MERVFVESAWPVSPVGDLVQAAINKIRNATARNLFFIAREFSFSFQFHRYLLHRSREGEGKLVAKIHRRAHVHAHVESFA